MVDIVILTKADRGISKETLVSIAKFAPKQRVILSINSGVMWEKGEKLVDYRLQAVRQTVGDWVYFLDDDDELINSFPEFSQLKLFDYVLMPLCDKGKVRSLMTCSKKRLFGFHIMMVKRAPAIRALEYAYTNQFWREDVAYCIWLIENYRGAVISEPLVQKNGDRIPHEVVGFREGDKQEHNAIWLDRLLAVRENILSSLPLVTL